MERGEKKRESRVHPPLSYVTESKLSGKKGHLGQGYPGRNTSWKIVPSVHPSTGKKRRVTSIAGNLIASLSSRKQPRDWYITRVRCSVFFGGNRNEKKKSTKIWKISLLVDFLYYDVIRKFSWKQIISIKICTLSILS